MEQDRIWDYYQSQTPEIFDENTGRLQFLASKVHPGEKVLDIGVGNGAFERITLARGVDTYSLDPSSESIERLKRDLSLGENAKVGYSQAIPFPDSFFDAVIMSEVLEHLSDEIISGTLKEVNRVLKVGGRFLGTVPSRENLTQNQVLCPHCGKGFHRWGHVRAFSPDSIREMLTPTFDIEKIIERKFITWRRRKGIAKIVAALKLSARFFGVRVPDESIFFSCKKR